MTTEHIKRRIERAEEELRIAKNELTRLQSPQGRYPYINKASEYLNSIACTHHISDDGLTLTIEDGYTWNTKGFDEAVHPKNFSITGNRIRLFA